MQLLALNGQGLQHGLWRGALVLQHAPGGAGVILDPTGALAARIEADRDLARRAGLEHKPRVVLITAARIDQVAGLIGLRHGLPIELYTTPSIFEDLTTTVPVLPEVQQHCDVHWRLIPVAGDQARAVFQIEQQPGLQFTVVASRPAPNGHGPAAGPVLGGPALALAVDDLASGRRFVWMRGRHRFGFATSLLLQEADLVVVSAECDRADPALEDWMASLTARHRWLLGGDTSARARLERLGIEQPTDGASIVL